MAALDGTFGVTIPPINDYQDTSCLVAMMDLIISVDTSLAHLAGAMGKPAWILLPWVPDWRWQLAREDSIWYASVTLIRQTNDQSWSHVLNVVRSRLANLFPEASR